MVDWRHRSYARSLNRYQRMSLATIFSAFGAIAQLGERLLCKQEVASSILAGSTYGQVIEHSLATGRPDPAHRLAAQVTQ